MLLTGNNWKSDCEAQPTFCNYNWKRNSRVVVPAIIVIEISFPNSLISVTISIGTNCMIGEASR